MLGSSIIKDYFVLAVDVAGKIMDQNAGSVMNLGCADATDACRDQVINALAKRLFRRPLGSVPGDISLTNLRAMSKSQATANDGMKLVLTAMLSSPGFLYKTYGSFASGASNVRPLNRYELASRLSFMLWSSAPDTELLESDLTNPIIMNEQIDRMFSDPRISRLASGFGNEWTGYKGISLSDLPSEFGVSQDLRAAAVSESREFLNHVLTKSPRMLDFIDGNYSYLNGPLANFYGISGVAGSDFQLVTNLPDQRGGILSQMSVLSSTSGGDVDTHPVKRGLWVVNQAMCITISDPPKDVDQNPEFPQAKSPKEFSEFHASSISCKGCHYVMDPIGLGLENYDAIGGWRTSYTITNKWAGKNLSVDPTSHLGSKNFSTPKQLRALIADDPRTYACLSEKVMKYSLGRSLTNKDYCVSEKIAKEVIGTDGSFREVVKRIAASDSFKKGSR
jgi:hypothetical protein